MAADRIRTTISLDPEVHAVFVKMAEAGGMSVSRCMGDWLADTADGAQFVAMKMQEARKAPKTVMREFQAMAAGLHEAISEEVGRVGGQRGAASPHPVDGKTADVVKALMERSKRKKAPPSSNTGGKSPTRGKGEGSKGVAS